MTKQKFRLEGIEGESSGEARVANSYDFSGHENGEEETFSWLFGCKCNSECRYDGCKGVDCSKNPKGCGCDGYCSSHCSCDSQCSHCSCVKDVCRCDYECHCDERGT
jgi:hypothetical protein